MHCKILFQIVYEMLHLSSLVSTSFPFLCVHLLELDFGVFVTGTQDVFNLDLLVTPNRQKPQREQESCWIQYISLTQFTWYNKSVFRLLLSVVHLSHSNFPSIRLWMYVVGSILNPLLMDSLTLAIFMTFAKIVQTETWGQDIFGVDGVMVEL